MLGLLDRNIKIYFCISKLSRGHIISHWLFRIYEVCIVPECEQYSSFYTVAMQQYLFFFTSNKYFPDIDQKIDKTLLTLEVLFSLSLPSYLVERQIQLPSAASVLNKGLQLVLEQSGVQSRSATWVAGTQLLGRGSCLPGLACITGKPESRARPDIESKLSDIRGEYYTPNRKSTWNKFFIF